MARMGRPQEYTPEIGKKILARISGGDSLRKIAEEPDMPARGTIMRWVNGEGNENFRSQWEVACKLRGELWAEEMVDIADETDDPQKANVQINTRKWVVSKLLPKVYGDKQQIDHTSGGKPLTAEAFKGMGEDKLKAMIALGGVEPE